VTAWMRRGWFLLAPVVLVACSAGDKTLTEVDNGVPPVEPTYEAVAAILDRSCAPCHHDDDEAGALPGLLDDDRNYATCRGIESDLDDIVDSSVDHERMPPGAWPRLTEEEKLLIRTWIEQGACSPCRPCR
jgi:uncharacterized membrane protein